MPSIPRSPIRALRRTVTITCAAGVLGLALPGGAALAQSGVPDDPEVDEYVPSLPDSEGDRPLGNGRGEGTGGPEAPEATLDPAVASDLEALGSDGQAVAELARTTAPDRDSGRGGSKADDDSAAVRLVGTLGGDDGGLGTLFPLLLVAILLAAIAYAVRRRRSPSE